MQTIEKEPTWPEAFQNVMFQFIEFIPELVIGIIVICLIVSE